jgi:GNAT superfamily N-acetyltransferase
MMPGTIMSGTEFIIRAAIPRDAAPLGLLSTELGYPSNGVETAERLRRLLETPGHAVLVAETAELEIVGRIHAFGTLRVEAGGFAELGGLVVSKSWRGRGVGARLVNSAESWALNNGYHKLRIRSREERDEAHGFYRHLGFVGCKTQRVFERRLAEDS